MTKMEMFTNAFLLMAAVVIVAYALVTETTDWIGRAEIIENRSPRLWAVMNNRPTRLVLIVVALVMISEVVQQLRVGAEPVESRFASPRVPNLEPVVLAPVEPPDSLRRRTISLADGYYAYVENRAQKHPPYAYPNSSDPSPSEERKKLIQNCQNYDQETQDYYMRHFKDRMVGIIREFDAKGVRTGYLGNSLAQRPPTVAQPGSMWELSQGDDLSQFRNLAYHVDAKDNLITF